MKPVKYTAWCGVPHFKSADALRAHEKQCIECQKQLNAKEQLPYETPMYMRTNPHRDGLD